MADQMQQLELGERVLGFPPSASEGDIQQCIGQFLESFGVEIRVNFLTPGGRADIYCPNRRIFVEVKAVGLAANPEKAQAREGGETPKEQLERYLRSEMKKELTRFPFLGDQAWVGIVTDGRVWHAWRYPHRSGSIEQLIIRDWYPANGSALVHWMQSLLEDGLVGKPVIPSNPIPLFKPLLDSLNALYEDQSGESVQQRVTKQLLWLDMLKTSSMEPSAAARDRLFVTHSFLVAVARGAIATLTNPTAPGIDGAKALQDGFVAWIVDTHAGRQWTQNLFDRVHQYEWRQQEGDVLRPLYEALVEEQDRKIFGEYYTPDWLADLMVREVLDESWCERAVAAALSALRSGGDVEGVGVLDPTCGSGTFLYHSARRILASNPARALAPAKQSAVVCLLVNGIDVHPIAAELARATLLRALPAAPPDGEASLRIYQGDALLARPGGEYTLLGSGDDWILIVTPRGHEVMMPRSFAVSASFAGDLRRIVDQACQGESTDLPSDIVESVPEADRPALRACYEAFRTIVREEGNSIWAWYIINICGPVLVSERGVDRVVANPPWVRMADIQVPERKSVLQKLASKTLEIWTGGKQSPHFDIASLFIKRVREEYLASPSDDIGAWLVKKAALRAGNWRKFRDWHRQYLSQTLDLEPLQPFGGGDARRSCVLMENCSCREITAESGGTLVAQAKGGHPIQPYDRLDEIRDYLEFSKMPQMIQQGVSSYIGDDGRAVFRQGATITPKVLCVVDHETAASSGNQVCVRTVRSQHKPWKDLNSQSGVVPGRWLSDLRVSKELVPFAMLPQSSRAIIPVDRRGDLLEDPSRECSFWKQLDEIYGENRGHGGNTPKSLIRRLDFNYALMSQLPLRSSEERSTVLYPTSADIMRASRFRGGAVIDSSLYRWLASSEDEAAYLTALLNAACLRVAFAQSRESGRHFHLHPWQKVRIPMFDAADRTHRELATAAERAEEIAESTLRDNQRALGQVGLSARIRDALVEDGISSEIDRLVSMVVPAAVIPAD